MTLRSDQGRLEIVAEGEPRAGDSERLMAEYGRLRAAYTAAARTLLPGEANFRDLPLPDAEADLRRAAARLAEALAEETAAARPSVRPLPPRQPRVATPAPVAPEVNDPSPAWTGARVGDVVVFRPRSPGRPHIRGTLAARLWTGDVFKGIRVEGAEQYEGKRWKPVPGGQSLVIYRTKGALDVARTAAETGAHPSGARPPTRAGDDAEMMERFDTLREGLGFYGAEGVAPSPEAFAALPLAAGRARLAALEARIETVRERMKNPALAGAPDFGAFIGAKQNHGGRPSGAGRSMR